MTDAANAQLSLSFINQLGEWEPDRGGDYETQNARGRAYAVEVLEVIQNTRNPAIFGSCVRAIAGAGIYGAVEIGFCHRLGVELLGI